MLPPWELAQLDRLLIFQTFATIISSRILSSAYLLDNTLEDIPLECQGFERSRSPFQMPRTADLPPNESTCYGHDALLGLLLSFIPLLQLNVFYWIWGMTRVRNYPTDVFPSQSTQAFSRPRLLLSKYAFRQAGL